MALFCWEGHVLLKLGARLVDVRDMLTQEIDGRGVHHLGRVPGLGADRVDHADRTDVQPNQKTSARY